MFSPENRQSRRQQQSDDGTDVFSRASSSSSHSSSQSSSSLSSSSSSAASEKRSGTRNAAREVHPPSPDGLHHSYPRQHRQRSASAQQQQQQQRQRQRQRQQSTHDSGEELGVLPTPRPSPAQPQGSFYGTGDGSPQPRTPPPPTPSQAAGANAGLPIYVYDPVTQSMRLANPATTAAAAALPNVYATGSSSLHNNQQQHGWSNGATVDLDSVDVRGGGGDPAGTRRQQGNSTHVPDVHRRYFQSDDGGREKTGGAPSRTQTKEKMKTRHAPPPRPPRPPPPVGVSIVADTFAYSESILLNYDGADRPWDTSACEAACGGQPAVCLLGSLCCLGAPCFIFQERRLLLFHSLRARYVCCLGTVPCCWPPVEVRPELYMGYTAPGNVDPSSSSPQQQQQQQQQQEGVVGHAGNKDPRAGPVLIRTEKYPPVAADGSPIMQPVVSTGGFSAPASVLSPATGLPQYGCYATVEQSKTEKGKKEKKDKSEGRSEGKSEGRAAAARRPAIGADTPEAPLKSPTPGGGYSCCCGCCQFHRETNTCTLNCCCSGGGGRCPSCGSGGPSCCLACRHPIACCLTGGCPVCCLAVEMCACMPCGALGNRLLLRRHYGFAPDPCVDDAVACMYSGCLTCLTGKRLEQRRAAYADGSMASERASCWLTFARSVSACAAATCCLWPCICCALAQQRDIVEKNGFPLLSAFNPSDITGVMS